jgi:membrane-associated phospholipid phosphatase
MGAVLVNLRLLLIFFAFACNSLLAEELVEKKSFFSQIGEELATPVTTKANIILGGSLLAAGMVYMNKGRRAYDKTESFSDAKPFGNLGYIGEVAGWGFLNGFYVLGHFSYGLYADDDESLQATEHMAKASLYTLFVTGALKTAIKERRPGYPEDRASFPSGHSSMSFAFASVVAARHGWFWGGMSYGAATYISVSRINDDWHYLHDVLVGMGIGASYGWGLYYAYENGLPFQFALVPLPRGGIAGTFGLDF